MDWNKDVFTLDNALHALLAVGITCLSIPLMVFLGAPEESTWVFAALAGVVLYLREAWQVDWDFTLKLSVHKHLEWAIGTVMGFIAAGLIVLLY